MLFDSRDSYVRDLTPLQAKRTRNVDQCGIDTLELILFDEINKYDRVLSWDAMGRLCEWVVASARTVRSDSAPVTTAVCKGSMQELAGKFLPTLRLGQGAKASQALTKALEGTRWAVGMCEGGDADYSFYHQSALESVEDICNTWGLEAQPEILLNSSRTRIASRKINLREHIGRSDCGLRLDYDTGLAEIDRVVSSDDVVTRLYCYGKGVQLTDEDGNATGGYSRKITFADINDGKEYVEDAALLAAYGIPAADGTMQHREGIYENGDCEDKAQLLAEGRTKLKELSAPSVSYEGSVEALGRAGFDGNACDLGDNVQLVDKSFETPLRLTGRVLGIVEDMLGDGSPDTVKLGNIVQPYTSRDTSIKQAVDRLTSSAAAWDDAAGLRGSYLDGLLNGINTILNATGGYVYLVQGEGLYVYDKPKNQNPTQCIMLGGGYLRIADSKNADGSWRFRTAATGSGFIADALVSGTVSANLVNAGTLSDKKGKNFWNLDTGLFQLSPADTSFGDTGKTLGGVVDGLDGKIDKASAAAIASRVKLYARNQSDSVAPVNAQNPELGWSETIPEWANGYFIWEMERITYGDGTVKRSAPVLSAALNKANQSAFDLNNSLDDLDATVTDLAKDGVVTEAEKAAVKKVQQAIDKEKEDVTTQFNNLKSNKSLNQYFLANVLSPSYTEAFGSGGSYASLNTAISDVLKCTTSDALKTAMDVYKSCYSTHSSNVNTYLSAARQAQHAIEQQDAKSMAQGLLDNYDDDFTQTKIFNRLTNNGATQGVYMSDGKLYLNATYLGVGTIADVTGTNSWNLKTGYFKTTRGTIGGFTIDKYTISNDTLSLRSNGPHFLYDGTDIGFIGTNGLVGYDGVYGLNFDLNESGGYMTWAAKKTASDPTYSMKWTYANKDNIGFTAYALNAGCDIDMRNWSIKNIGNGCTSTLRLAVVMNCQKSGNFEFANNCNLTFEGGLLKSFTWGKGWYS